MFSLLVAAELKDQIDYLANTYKNVSPVLLEVHRSQDELENLIKGHDVIIRYTVYRIREAAVNKLIAKKVHFMIKLHIKKL